MSRPGLKATAILAVLALLGMHVHARSKPEGDLGVADRAILSVSGPIQGAFSRALDAVSGVASHYVLLVGVSRENERLRAELDAARAATAELAELRSENDRLRDMVALRARADARTVAASVIGRGTTSRFRTLRIDRGLNDGVESGMAVLAPSGAVGRILRSSGGYADVLLLTDGLSAAGAVVQQSRLRGVALGDGSDVLRVGFVRRSDAAGVAAGDVVVTSGEDGIFPEGVALGTVISASAPETGLFLGIEMQTAVDMERLDEVLVVLERGAGPFAPVPEAGGEVATGPLPAGGAAAIAQAGATAGDGAQHNPGDPGGGR